MPSLLVAVICLTAIAQSSKPQIKQPPASNSASTHSNNGNQVTPPTIVVSDSVLNEQKAQEDKKTVKNYHIDSFFTGVIAAFTVLTFWIYRGQLNATKIAERAWMVSNSISELPIYDHLARQPAGKTFPLRFLQTNLGRTPAWITAMGSRANLVSQGQNLPIEPIYDWSGPFPPEGTVLPPQANIPQGADITLDDLSHIDNGDVTLYFYGAVKYRDVFRKKHEARYCYIFKPKPSAIDLSPRDFCIGGPANYNQAT